MLVVTLRVVVTVVDAGVSRQVHTAPTNTDACDLRLLSRDSQEMVEAGAAVRFWVGATLVVAVSVSIEVETKIEVEVIVGIVVDVIVTVLVLPVTLENFQLRTRDWTAGVNTHVVMVVPMVTVFLLMAPVMAIVFVGAADVQVWRATGYSEEQKLSAGLKPLSAVAIGAYSPPLHNAEGHVAAA